MIGHLLCLSHSAGLILCFYIQNIPNNSHIVRERLETVAAPFAFLSERNKSLI